MSNTRDAAPIIVSALFGAEDFAWLDGLRRAHFPPDRNQLSAHLTLFHQLPASVESELDRLLVEATCAAPPPATADALISLGRGVAIHIDSPQLRLIRRSLAGAFTDHLSAQDAAGWRPHVTVQNKVHPDDARELRTALERDFQPRPLSITGLAAWWYRGGPWEPLAQYMFG